jgi:hypothetical protein
LNKQAVLSAKRISKIDSKAARWVAADVLKEIQGEKVQARLAEKTAKAKAKAKKK